MNRQVSLYIAATLDGYIATKDDDLNWLFNVEGDGDNGYAEFYKDVDTIIMGRSTYQWVLDELEEFPYQGKECYVFTTQAMAPHEAVTFVNEDVASFVEQLKRKQGDKIWIVGGGKLLQAFFNSNLIDEYIIYLAPVILGEGIPLFHAQTNAIELELVNATNSGQFAELRYLKKANNK